MRVAILALATFVAVCVTVFVLVVNEATTPPQAPYVVVRGLGFVVAAWILVAGAWIAVVFFRGF